MVKLAIAGPVGVVKEGIDVAPVIGSGMPTPEPPAISNTTPEGVPDKAIAVVVVLLQ